MADEAILAIHLAAGHNVGRYVDCCVSDPPYGIGFVHGGSPNELYHSKFAHVPVIGDDKPFDPSHLLAFEHLLLWGANNYADRLPSRNTNGVPCRWLVWDKRCGRGTNDQGDCELAWVRSASTLTCAPRVFYHFWNGYCRDSERGIPRVHPTQKPEVLMSWCLQFMPAGAAVLDPYCGSGSTLVAAKLAQRRAVGIEIDEKYCEIAANRLSQEVLDFEQRDESWKVFQPVPPPKVDAQGQMEFGFS